MLTLKAKDGSGMPSNKTLCRIGLSVGLLAFAVGMFLSIRGIHRDHKRYGHQLAARVTHVTPVERRGCFLGTGCTTSRHATITVTTLNGDRFVYSDLRVRADTVKGQGARVWFRKGDPDWPFIDIELNDDGSSQLFSTPWSPWYIPPILGLFLGAIVGAFSIPVVSAVWGLWILLASLPGRLRAFRMRRRHTEVPTQAHEEESDSPEPPLAPNRQLWSDWDSIFM